MLCDLIPELITFKFYTMNERDTESKSSIISYTELHYCEKLKLLLNPENSYFAESIIDSRPFNIFNLLSSFSFDELKQLLTDYGTYIKRLRLDSSSSEEYSLPYLNLLSTHCANLREIFFASVEITTTNEFGQILSSGEKTIEKLTLDECIVREPACLLIANMSQLQVLNLESSEVSGQGFGRLENLTELQLLECKNFHSENFIDILKSNKLVKLDVAGVEGFSNNVDLDDSEHSQICSLKTLREISIGVGSNLREIYFKDVEITPTNEFGQILSSAQKTIEKLTLVRCTVKEPSCSLIANMSPSQVLNLESSEVSGQGFGRLENLTELQLLGCKKFHSENFIDTIKSNKLVKLVVAGVAEFSDNVGLDDSEHSQICSLKTLREISIGAGSNQREIYFRNVEITPTNEFGQILSSGEKTIEKLTLDECIVRESACLLIANMSQLQVLNLESSEVSGQGFGRLENLTELQLLECKNFHSENFIDILKSNKLVKLDVAGVEGFSNNVDLDDSEHSQICSLKTLREISIGVGSNLREIYFKDVEITPTNEFGQILSSAQKTIEKLTLVRCTVKEPSCSLIANMSPSQVLNLESSEVSGQGFGRLENLTELQLLGCKKFHSKHFIDTIKSNKLVKLVVAGVEEFSDNVDLDDLEHSQTCSLKTLREISIGVGSNLREIYFEDVEITPTNEFGQILSSAQKTIEKLTLDECIVREPTCSLIANMSQLQVLNLESSEASGQGFGRLENLTELKLLGCKKFHSKHFIDTIKSNKLVKLVVAGVEEFSDNVGLDDSEHSQTCSLKTLREISIGVGSNLREIYFEDVEITPTNEFGQILSSAQKTIEKLTLDECIVREPACLLIANMSQLQVLNLESSEVSGQGFGRLENLTELQLLGCKKFHRENFIDILKSNKLVKLVVAGVEEFSDNVDLDDSEHSQICSLKTLREISIGVGSNLREIYFQDVEITPTNEFGQILSSAQKTIEKLTLDECIVREPTCSLIANMSQLQVLNLESSEASGQGFGRLENLTELKLLGCKKFHSKHFIDTIKSNKLVKLVVAGVEEFSDNVGLDDSEHSQTCSLKTLREISIGVGSNLREIYFEDVEITPTNEFGQILSSAQKTIEKLTLDECIVREPACSLIANMSQLQVLNLESSEVSGQGFGRLENLTKLQLLGCKKFHRENFIDILKSNKLVKLVVAGVEEFSGNVDLDDSEHSQTCSLKTLRKISIGVGLNVREIYFQDVEITPTNEFGQILSSAQKTIEKLTLDECIVREPACLLIANMSQLQVLNLESSEVSGQGFGRLENLTELQLLGCKKFHSENFIDILKSNKLVKLVVAGVEEFSGNVDRDDSEHSQICSLKTLREISIGVGWKRPPLGYLKELVNNHVPLESLEIKPILPGLRIPVKITSEIVDKIIQLENLRALSFRDYKLFEDSHLVKISVCQKIEMLDLGGVNFSDLGIIGCVKHLKNLRYLNIAHCDLGLYRGLFSIRKQPGFMHSLVLYLPRWTFNDVRMYAKHADMAHVQLTGRPMISETDRSILERLGQLNQESHLLALNDDCLRHIMQFLPLDHQLKLTLLNSRFEHFVQHFLRVYPFKTAEVLANLMRWQIRDLVPRFGEMVKKLHITRPRIHCDAECYDLMAKYFTNVVELHCTDENFSLRPDVELCRKIIIKSRDSLEVIDVKHLKIDNEFALEIAKATKLHTLSLTCSKLTGINLGDLTKLTSLNLSYVEDLEPASFIAICKSIQLKDLNIMGCKKINNESFQVLVETQSDLETLAIGENSAATNTSLVARLKNLKDLTLSRCTRVELLQCTRSFTELTRVQLKLINIYDQYELNAAESSTFAQNIAALQNLIYLRISESSAINIYFIRTIAEGCRLLKVLDLAGATNLTDEGVLEAIRLFKHLRHFGVNGCERHNFAATYRRALKIKREISSRWRLVLYIDRSREIIEDLKKTADYQFQVVEVSDKNLSQLNKYELIKERLISPSTESIEAENLNEIARQFTISQARDFFATWTGRIKKIEISMRIEPELIDYIKLLQPYCSHLYKIDIDCNNIQLHLDREEVMPLFHAEDLKLKRLRMKDSLDVDEVLEHLVETPSALSICYLDVSGSRLSGHNIAAFRNITHLHLEGCSTVENAYFQSICNNLRLTQLNIAGVNELDDFSFEELIRTQNNHLKTLSMSCKYAARNCTDVAKIQRLKHINILVDVLLDEFENFLPALLGHANHIEYMNIHSGIDSPKDDLRFNFLIHKEESRHFGHSNCSPLISFTEFQRVLDV